MGGTAEGEGVEGRKLYGAVEHSEAQAWAVVVVREKAVAEKASGGQCLVWWRDIERQRQMCGGRPGVEWSRAGNGRPAFLVEYALAHTGV